MDVTVGSVAAWGRPTSADDEMPLQLVCPFCLEFSAMFGVSANKPVDLTCRRCGAIAHFEIRPDLSKLDYRTVRKPAWWRRPYLALRRWWRTRRGKHTAYDDDNDDAA